MKTSDKTEAEDGEVVRGEQDFSLLHSLAVFLFCFCFPFLTRTNCESLQERTGNHKPPPTLHLLSEDTATTLAHAGTRTYTLNTFNTLLRQA